LSPNVDENKLKGNYGEHLAALILSQSCLVRPVVGNTDVGVDLYCESVINNRPFLHFWVQVKSSKHFPNKETTAQYSFKTSNLDYWSRQPVPVLAFLVPVKERSEDINFIHVVDVTFDILEHGIKDQGKQTLTSKPDLTLPVSDSVQLSLKLEHLLGHHIPKVVSAMYAEKGFLYPAPTLQEQYVQRFAVHLLPRCIPKIEHRTRDAVAFSVIQYIDAGHNVDEFPKMLLSALEAIGDESRYQVQEALGVVAQAREDLAKAKSHYQNAIQSITSDTYIDHRVPPWAEIVSRLEHRIRSSTLP